MKGAATARLARSIVIDRHRRAAHEHHGPTNPGHAHSPKFIVVPREHQKLVCWQGLHRSGTRQCGKFGHHCDRLQRGNGHDRKSASTHHPSRPSPAGQDADRGFPWCAYLASGGRHGGALAQWIGGSSPLIPRMPLSLGPALTAHSYPADFFGVAGAAMEAEPGDVIMCTNEGYTGTAVIGDLAVGRNAQQGHCCFRDRRTGARPRWNCSDRAAVVRHGHIAKLPGQ